MSEINKFDIYNFIFKINFKMSIDNFIYYSNDTNNNYHNYKIVDDYNRIKNDYNLLFEFYIIEKKKNNNYCFIIFMLILFIIFEKLY
jgi:hypothetical protein